MAETRRPIITGETDAERAVALARYNAREAQFRAVLEAARESWPPVIEFDRHTRAWSLNG
jgi:hypothetical protein